MTTLKEIVLMVRETPGTLSEKVELMAGWNGERFTGSLDIFRAFHQLASWERETFCIVLLDGKNKPVGFSVVSIGTMTASLVHPREVFRPAIIQGAVGVVCLHNHPSGDPKPSAEDLQITRRLVEAGRLLGVRVLDHVIVGKSRHFSFADEGLI